MPEKGIHTGHHFPTSDFRYTQWVVVDVVSMLPFWVSKRKRVSIIYWPPKRWKSTMEKQYLRFADNHSPTLIPFLTAVRYGDQQDSPHLLHPLLHFPHAIYIYQSIVISLPLCPQGLSQGRVSCWPKAFVEEVNKSHISYLISMTTQGFTVHQNNMKTMKTEFFLNSNVIITHMNSFINHFQLKKQIKAASKTSWRQPRNQHKQDHSSLWDILTLPLNDFLTIP